MTELSPAAQAVRKAYYSTNNDLAGPALATALRAAADQIVPPKTLRSYLNDYERGVWEAEECVRTGLLDIADELEGTN
ncbi:MAG: hypothetical protein EBU08_14285 [Micrococcales bacterium]|nr:hypothetical protein [Micrococcales bacterium]